MSATAPPETHLPRTVPGWLPYLWARVLFPGSPDAATGIRLWSLIVVLALPAVLLYPTLNFMLLEPDEGRYAQIPKEMLDRGAWVVPTLQGEPYLDKPPLMYWLVRLSFAIFGVSESAARLVPAICVHLTILAVYLIGRRSVGERAAFWAALLLTVSPGYSGVARLLLLDGLLTLCVTTSVLCGFEAVRTGKLLRGWWIAAALASGLGFLTKGPISEVLLFPPLLAFAFLTRSPTRVGWRNLFLFAAIVISVNVPWYVAIFLKEPAFLKHFFWEHNVMRFLQPFDHLQPIWYYVPILIGGFFPGVAIGFFFLRGLLFGGPEAATSRTASGGFWLLSGLWCCFFFSCSGSKLPTYILPAFPPLALAMGECIARAGYHRSWWARTLVATFAGLLLVLNFVGLPWYAKERSPMGQPELIAPYLSNPDVPVVCFPRNTDSVAFYTGRSDLTVVRTKEINQFIVDCHFRPKTVILFTHRHSIDGFREAIPATLRITQTTSLKRKGTGIEEKILGGSPWGLCDIAVVEPVVVQTR